MNQFEITVTAEAFGQTPSDSDTATVTGNMVATLGVEFDPATQEVTSVDELEFTGGTIHLSDVSLTLNFGFLLGRVDVTGSGVSGTLDTPDPPGAVTGGEFNTAEHLVILNEGQFHAAGTGLIGGLFDPITIVLSEQPIEATSEMTGRLDVSLHEVVGEVATYDALLRLPVDFDEEIYNQDGVVVTLAVAGTLEAAGQFSRPVPLPAEVVARRVFYNHSSFDGNDPTASAQDDEAIAPDKEALLPGQTATFANYTSYRGGINGIMVDVENLPPGTGPDADDFEFHVGNDNAPGAWASVAVQPTVTVRRGAGAGGSDRLTLIWPDNAIQKQWLQVTVLANDDTGLSQPDVSYFGNAIGESGNSTTDAKVNAYDMLAARDNQRTFLDPAPIELHYDYDRDARVDATDMLIARNNGTHFLNALQLITVPPAKAAAGVNDEAQITDDERASSSLVIRVSGFLNGLHEFDRSSEQNRRSGRDDPARQAVDRLLGTWGHD